MNNTISFNVVFLAGGIGTRMGATIPKQYLSIQNKPLALHSFAIFASMPEIKQIVVVCEAEYEPLFLSVPTQASLSFARPGPRRQDSLFNGIQFVQEDSLICVHDSARPFVDHSIIRKVVFEANQCGAAAIGVRVKSTIKVCDGSQAIIHTPNRMDLWEMQTPQVVRLNLLKEGFTLAEKDKLTVTDDVSLVELIGKPAKVVEGTYRNIKITTPEDLFMAQQWFEKPCTLTN